MLGDGGPPAYFQVRVMICLTLFALWPFTRLVHAFTALIGYLFWPYVVYRSRDVAAKDELVGLHPRRRGGDARFIPRLVPQPTWVAGGG